MSQNITYTTEAALQVVRSKVPSFHKDAVDLTLRNRIAFPLAKKWGNLMLGVDVSWARIWNAKNKLPDVDAWVDTPDQDYASGPEQQQYSIGVGGYISKDTLSEQEFEMISGSKTQIINLYTEKAVDVQTAISNRLNYAFLHGTGTGREMSGMDTFLATSTTAAATDKVAKPGDTYAGQSTAVGVEGTWNSDLTTPPNASIGNDWPENPYSVSPEYDWNAPLILVRNGAWDSGNEWNTNAFEVMRYYCGVQRNRGAQVTDPSAAITAICGEAAFREFRTLCDSRNYRLEPVQDAINIGMPRTFYFEDTWMTFDSDVNTNQVYMVQPDMMEFFTSPGFKNIWKLDGPYEFKPEMRHLYNARTLGNWRFQPKFHGLIKDF